MLRRLRHIVALVPQGAADVKADHLRQHHIQQDDVRIFTPGLFQTVRPVIGFHSAVALPLEIKAQNVYNILLVLHNQNGFLLFSLLFHVVLPLQIQQHLGPQHGGHGFAIVDLSVDAAVHQLVKGNALHIEKFVRIQMLRPKGQILG